MIKDIERGIAPKDAGWISEAVLAVSAKARDSLLARNWMVRSSSLAFRLNVAKKEELKASVQDNDAVKAKVEFALEDSETLHRDLLRLAKGEKILARLTKNIKSGQAAWSTIVAGGWWVMIGSSGVPAALGEVVDAGFSPRDWAIKAPWSAYELGQEAASRVGGGCAFGKVQEAIQTYAGKRSVDVLSPPPVTREDVEKTMKVLNWKKLVGSLPVGAIKACGFAWFAYAVLDEAGAIPITQPTSSKLERAIAGATFEACGFSTDEIQTSVENAANPAMPWAVDIIRVPEVGL